MFEAVQQKLSSNQSHKTLTRHKADHLLRDLLFDDAGHRMIATHATKAGLRYRYYVSQPGLHGESRTAALGSVSRVPAPEIEQAITSALQKHLADNNIEEGINGEQIKFDHTTLATLVSRVEVQSNQLVTSVTSLRSCRSLGESVLQNDLANPPAARSLQKAN